MTDYTHNSFIEVRMPGILDGTDQHREERNLIDESSTTEEVRATLRRVERLLERTSDYGCALWTKLSEVVTYLREDLARGGTGAGMLHTDEEWERWQEIYASALSTLAGPRGDSGYGASQATLERQNRSSR